MRCRRLPWRLSSALGVALESGCWKVGVCSPTSRFEAPSRSWWLQEFLPQFQPFNLSPSFPASAHWHCTGSVESLSCDQQSASCKGIARIHHSHDRRFEQKQNQDSKALHFFITTTTADSSTLEERLSKFITTYHTGRSLRRSMRGSLPSLSRSLSLSLPPTPARSLCLSPSSRLKETWDCRRHEWPA